MRYVNKKDFLESDDIKYKDVFVEELNGYVKLKALSLKEQLEFEKIRTNNDDDIELIAYLITKCCVDENKNYIFNEEDVELLKNKSSSLILHLFNEILEVNQLTQNDIDKLAKNS